MDASLATQCLAFCQALSIQGQAFTLALTVGSTFSFSLDTREKTTPIKVRKKKPSPSPLKRNAQRKEDYLLKPAVKPSVPGSETLLLFPVNRKKEATVVKRPTYKEKQKPQSQKCVKCEATFMTKNGLKVHMEMMHINITDKEVVKCKHCPFRSSSSTVEFPYLMVHYFLVFSIPGGWVLSH